MKKVEYVFWEKRNVGATNESKFSALPTGMFENGHYIWIREGFWWSSTKSENDSVRIVQLSGNYSAIKMYNYKEYKTVGLSVRCVKD